MRCLGFTIDTTIRVLSNILVAVTVITTVLMHIVVILPVLVVGTAVFEKGS